MKRNGFSLKAYPGLVMGLVLLGWGGSCAMAQEERGKRGSQRGGAGGGSGLGNYEKPPAANTIPDHPYNIVLGRPTSSSMEVRVLQMESGWGQVWYREKGSKEWEKSELVEVVKGRAVGIVLRGLKGNAEYEYQWRFENPAGGKGAMESEPCWFCTQRGAESRFTFTVTADSHLDENSSGEVYLQTLKNALASRPDFHLELGDTFMTGKYVEPERAYGQYLAQRYYLSHLCRSAPLFFVMGNHDGESAGRGSMRWATTTRKSLFANPIPDDFYSGNAEEEPDLGYPENYYAWEWGGAQFVVLDPYRYTSAKRRGGRGGAGREGMESNWYWTLGERQYRWLAGELAKPARYRFVFIHHLVGGAIQNQRGGVEVAKLWEWGGHNAEGVWEFETERPGWREPIHAMLVRAGVTIVFHGHDHFFAKQDLDGIVYLEVPQPSHMRAGNTRNAAEYGYAMGDFQPSSGFVRVGVDREGVRLDYVRTAVGNGGGVRNGEVGYSCRIESRDATGRATNAREGR